MPSLAAEAAHVTMLQRTPSYVLSLPGTDPLAAALRKRLPGKVAYPIVRWKNVLVSTASYQFSRRRPEAMKAFVIEGMLKALPHDFEVDTHFTPPYAPWDQRLCLIPDGDLFSALGSGKASIVTGRIERFTERGIRLESGDELEADVIVTATGLALRAIGGMKLTVDGRPVGLSDTVSYKGVMVSGVPNFSLVIGYTNNSWTLKADLVSGYVVRLLKHLDRNGYASATPVGPRDEAATGAFLDLSSGYVQRGLDMLPRQRARAPWRLYQHYLRDVVGMRHGRLTDQGMTFQRRRPATAPATVPAA
ncbi:hypothetical protein SAMN05661080_01416 [Modestobacter sp. DSM 44400]|uniref:flavin-containing monooxygenase n=1 Tax=Modestobacter sp. DSM 44400 TaxID=1550230 RepID=UPI000897DC12|nr:NAD(P)/FAD-dependent oxidoreductase [Modestobacter sp. DSM 44400]SDX84148.1 hypothetical protein SAMN05661080_01416 [Modestobacter sp. DSM 44400]